MISEPDQAEAFVALLESTAFLLRGICLDPTVPQHAKAALQSRVEEIEVAVAEALRENT